MKLPLLSTEDRPGLSLRRLLLLCLTAVMLVGGFLPFCFVADQDRPSDAPVMLPGDEDTVPTEAVTARDTDVPQTLPPETLPQTEETAPPDTDVPITEGQTEAQTEPEAESETEVQTEPPATAASTDAPATEPPATDAPVTEVLATDAPATEPPEAEPLPEEDGCRRVPILLYHHITEEAPTDSGSVSKAAFTAQMQAIKEAGYTTVTFDDLRRYAVFGQELPEKPVLITFDDGYLSNYTIAYPILRQLDMKATVFVIGVSVGKDTYKDTGEPMTPHFTWEQAAEMERSGVITVESHGYDIHEVAGRDAEPIRRGILKKEGESEEEYAEFVWFDCVKQNENFWIELDKEASVLAFPYGYRDALADAQMEENGIIMTVTTQAVTAVVVKDHPESLYNMGRYHVREDTDILRLLEEAMK